MHFWILKNHCTSNLVRSFLTSNTLIFRLVVWILVVHILDRFVLHSFWIRDSSNQSVPGSSYQEDDKGDEGDENNDMTYVLEPGWPLTLCQDQVPINNCSLALRSTVNFFRRFILPLLFQYQRHIVSEWKLVFIFVLSVPSLLAWWFISSVACEFAGNGQWQKWGRSD